MLHKPWSLGICNRWLNTPEIRINKMTGKYKFRKFTEASHEKEKNSRGQTNAIILNSKWDLPTRYPSVTPQAPALPARRTPRLCERLAVFTLLSKSPPPPPPSSPSWAPRQKLFGGLGPMYRQEALYRHLGNKAIIFSGYSNEILIRNPLKKTELILELMRSGVLKFPPLEVLKNQWLGYFPNLQWEWDVILLFRGLRAPRVETWVCKWI